MNRDINLEEQTSKLNSSVITDDTIQKIMENNKRITSMFIHELRNPLSLIKGTLQYIETKHPEAKEYKYWGQLFELIEDMSFMITDASILNINTVLNLENTNLITLAQTVVNNYMPQADKQQKHLSIKVAPECEAVLISFFCDSTKMKQVLSNLIKNALEATSVGDYIEVILNISLGNTSPMVSIQINNNGPSIDEDFIESIFQPFVTHKKNGTGIGLALAKRIIECHLGTINVSSCEEVTSFTILLPVATRL